nr:4-hydroxybenzoate decarboxylase subunit C [Chlamydiota bacterium]
MINLRQFLRELRKRGEVVDIHSLVDPDLEIAEIHRRVAAENGPALFFHNVKNSSFPVVTNLFGSPKRIEIAFGQEPELFVEGIVRLLKEEFPPKLSTLWHRRSLVKKLLHLGIKKRSRAPVMEQQMTPVDLEKLPLLKSWPLDGGPFITLPLVYTEPPGGGPSNLGMYRIQRFDKTTTGLHFQIGKGGGFHFHEPEAVNQPLPVNIFLGGPPALILSAITPLPENITELLFCLDNG